MLFSIRFCFLDMSHYDDVTTVFLNGKLITFSSGMELDYRLLLLSLYLCSGIGRRLNCLYNCEFRIPANICRVFPLTNHGKTPGDVSKDYILQVVPYIRFLYFYCFDELATRRYRYQRWAILLVSVIDIKFIDIRDGRYCWYRLSISNISIDANESRLSINTRSENNGTMIGWYYWYCYQYSEPGY